MLCPECKRLGADTGYAEVYRVLDDEDHCAECDLGSCQPCGVVAELSERYVRGLSVYMTDAEAEIFADILIRISERQQAGK